MDQKCRIATQNIPNKILIGLKMPEKQGENNLKI